MLGFGGFRVVREVNEVFAGQLFVSVFSSEEFLVLVGGVV